jgi:hypothetical protein
VVFEIALTSDKLVPLDLKEQLAETIIQGTTTLLCTILISLYLIFKQWQQRKLIGMENNINL